MLKRDFRVLRYSYFCGTMEEWRVRYMNKQEKMKIDEVVVILKKIPDIVLDDKIDMAVSLAIAELSLLKNGSSL